MVIHRWRSSGEIYPQNSTPLRYQSSRTTALKGFHGGYKEENSSTLRAWKMYRWLVIEWLEHKWLNVYWLIYVDKLRITYHVRCGNRVLNWKKIIFYRYNLSAKTFFIFKYIYIFYDYVNVGFINYSQIEWLLGVNKWGCGSGIVIIFHLFFVYKFIKLKKKNFILENAGLTHVTVFFFSKQK